jgi:hypothetical protein
MSFNQAYQMAKTSVSDPARYVADYVKNAMAAQENSLSSERKSPQQLEREAIDSYQRIRQLSSQGAQSPESPNAPTDVDSLIDSFLQ